MKKTVIVAILGICFFPVWANGAIQWMYDSPLTVVENITDIGGGEYLYEYSFTNVDTSPIWGFGIFLTFDVTPQNTFDIPPSGTPGGYWIGPYFGDITPGSAYDGSILDASIYARISTSNEAGALGGNPVVSIMPNQFVSGFSFTSSVLDDSPKYYYYCTIASGNPSSNGTGEVAAVGTTVPEPCLVVMLSFGLAILSQRKH